MSSASLQDTRSTHKNQILFLYTNNEYEETEIKNTIPFTVAPEENEMYKI